MTNDEREAAVELMNDSIDVLITVRESIALRQPLKPGMLNFAHGTVARATALCWDLGNKVRVLVLLLVLLGLSACHDEESRSESTSTQTCTVNGERVPC